MDGLKTVWGWCKLVVVLLAGLCVCIWGWLKKAAAWVTEKLKKLTGKPDKTTKTTKKSKK